MIKLINWTAKRAGGRITLNGTNAETLTPLKIVGVDTIQGALWVMGTERTGLTRSSDTFTIATDKNGVTYELG